MKKMLAVALLIPSLAFGATWTLVTSGAQANTGSSVQNLTGTAPSTSTEGFGLGARKSCYVTVCAQAAATITAGGTQAYLYAPHLALWTRWAAADLTLTTGNRCATHLLPALPPIQARLEIVPNAVTVSAGTQVTISFRCTGPVNGF